MSRACSTNRGGVRIGYWWESQKRQLGIPRDRLEDNIKIDWSGLVCLRLWTSGGLL
jgi:hypothetical protein